MGCAGAPADPGGRGPARAGWSPTGPTATPSPAPRCAVAASGTPSPSADQKDWRARQGSRGGRPPAFDRKAYRQRNVVERCFNRLKQNRALATRYAKRAVLYRALVVIAAIRIWLK
jgi:transposase